MKVYYDLNDFQKLSNAVVTSGTFDGVHLGHKKIISRAVEKARQVEGESVIITFWPHPRIVLSPNESIKLLSTIEERIALIAETNPDHLIIIPFTKAFSEISSEDFIKKILVDKIGTCILIMGYDHRFGKNREGSFEFLLNHSIDYGFEIEEIPRKDLENITISSTNIRQALQNGDAEKAASLLGHLYSFSGTVVKGNQLGRTIGFPTANLQLESENKLLPNDGVYAVEVITEGGKFGGMMNIGFRPTIDGKKNVIEVNIFDFDKDIYGETLKVSFIKYIRTEKKFSSLEDLKNQLKEDKNIATEFLKNHYNRQSNLI